jgi:hypothetical protein
LEKIKRKIVSGGAVSATALLVSLGCTGRQQDSLQAIQVLGSSLKA